VERKKFSLQILKEDFVSVVRDEKKEKEKQRFARTIGQELPSSRPQEEKRRKKGAYTRFVARQGNLSSAGPKEERKKTSDAADSNPAEGKEERNQRVLLRV